MNLIVLMTPYITGLLDRKIMIKLPAGTFGNSYQYRIIEKNGKYGVIERRTEECVIDFVFDEINYEYLTSVLSLRLGYKWGFLPYEKIATLTRPPKH